MCDGELIFALSMGWRTADLHRIGFAAAEMVAPAVIRAVMQAQTRGGIPSYAEVIRVRT
jgi:L-aminopeptidase/D-esterase-like protein